MGNNGSGIYDPRQYKQFDATNIDNYEQDYEENWASRIEKVYEIPDIADMPGVFLRGIIKNERSLNAMLRLAYRHQKFGDTNHQELLRMKIAGTAAIGGVARLDALFAATDLVASDMYRAARNLPKLKKQEKEEIHRGSDFRNIQRNEGIQGAPA